MNSKLQTAYEDYIDLLEDELKDLSGLAYAHGYKSPRVEQGEICRNKIKELKDQKNIVYHVYADFGSSDDTYEISIGCWDNIETAKLEKENFEKFIEKVKAYETPKYKEIEQAMNDASKDSLNKFSDSELAEYNKIFYDKMRVLNFNFCDIHEYIVNKKDTDTILSFEKEY